MRDAFDRLSSRIARMVGSYLAFLVACTVIIIWAASGTWFGFSDTWQLVINTGTTIVTFLMVFLIQATQNRDARATQLKLDELIRAVTDARATFIDIEEGTERDLDTAEAEFRQSRSHDDASGRATARSRRKRAGGD